ENQAPLFLYVEGLSGGLGSNPVGLDRGQLGKTRLVRFRRLGGRLLVEEMNLAFRAETPDSAERQSVDRSFAHSVIWGGAVEAEAPDGRFLVELTSFIVRDAHESAATLKRTGQGTFSLDAARSGVDLDASRFFPDNLELEAVLTFAGGDPGAEVRQTVPAPRAVTLTQHHSLLRLPGPGYRPRRFDPRAGLLDLSFKDYSAPLAAPLMRHWIVRHRLEKGGTLVYYVDRGVPEPVRSALIEGASWWARAFAAAGFPEGFSVRLLPEGIDPLDARYNVIQWVHRSTRGWSYGGGVVDPRSGEMIKANVLLGSQRIRQDRLLFQGLAGTSAAGTGSTDDPVELSLARIRQLAAHEVGHTLGLSHNFAASTYGRASVMDYPAPKIGIKEDGRLDFSHAYAVGVGDWDIQAVRYAYTVFPRRTDENRALEALVEEGLSRGLYFLTDEDARPAGAAQPMASLWDNGTDPVAGLNHSLEVRRLALSRFSEDRIASGQPLSMLQAVLVPLYLHHRYQLTAALKVIGGLDYRHAVRGDHQPPARMLDPEKQREALSAVLHTLDPEVLDLPEELLSRLLPRSPGNSGSRELFAGRSGPVFDPLEAAGTAARLAITGLLQPERAARLVDFHRRDPSMPALEEVLDRLITHVFELQDRPPRQVELARRVKTEVVDGLLHLAEDERSSAAVRARAHAALRKLARRLRRDRRRESAAGRAHSELLGLRIRRFLDRRGPVPTVAKPLEAPPGSPIGWRGSGPSLH
ncbi:MAG: zinc-dependent metalloprotease, partial [Acidobacteriota bacterium]